MMFIQICKLATYHISFTLKRLDSININILTNKCNLYYVCNKLCSNASYNILINNGKNRETNEINVYEKNFSKSKNEVNGNENREKKTIPSIEINFAYKVLNRSKIDHKPFTKPISIERNVHKNETQNLLSKDWNYMNTTEIITNLELISWYAYKNFNKISKTKYEDILNTILKHRKVYNFYMIYRILYSIELSYGSIDDLDCTLFLQKFVQNFKNVKYLSTKQILLINDLLYRLNYIDSTHFMFKSLSSIVIENLDFKDLMQYAFLLRICQPKINVCLNKLEQIFAKYSRQMTVEELGLMALVFYKYKYNYTKKDLILLFINNLKQNITSIDPVCMGVIVKSLKGSIYLEFMNKYIHLLKIIEIHIPHINSLCLTHILHLQARTLIDNDKIITKALQRYLNNMENLRIKDIERILLTLYQFNYDSKVTPFYSHAAEELVKPSRKEEQQMFPKSFIYCAQYLLQANFCFKKILEIIMNPAFIKLTSANEICNAYIYIHNCLELDHPEIKDQFKLDNSLLTTFYTIAELWNKNLKGHLNKRQQFAADVIYNFKCTFGLEAHIHTDLLLPHMFRNDIVVCYNRKMKQFHPPHEELSKIPERTIKYAPNDGNTWYTLIVTSANNLLKTSKLPSGLLTMHIRHLKRAGYTPILINYCEWIERKGDLLKEIFDK